MNYLLKIIDSDDKVTYTVSRYPDKISINSLAKQLTEYKSIELVKELDGLISFPEVRNKAMIEEINSNGYTLSGYGFGYKQDTNYRCIIVNKISNRLRILKGNDILSQLKKIFTNRSNKSMTVDIDQYGLSSFDIKIEEVKELYDIRDAYNKLGFTTDYPRVDNLDLLYNPLEYLNLFKNQGVLSGVVCDNVQGVHYHCYLIKEESDSHTFYVGKTDRLDLLKNKKILHIINTSYEFKQPIIQVLTSYTNSHIHDALIGYWSKFIERKYAEFDNVKVDSDPYKLYKYTDELFKDVPNVLDIPSVSEIGKFLAIYNLINNRPSMSRYRLNQWKVEGLPKTNEEFFAN